jgi:hypothetical protein
MGVTVRMEDLGLESSKKANCENAQPGFDALEM